eukprot:10884699-Lingulodinium_polyedra.AAC.1
MPSRSPARGLARGLRGSCSRSRAVTTRTRRSAGQSGSFPWRTGCGPPGGPGTWLFGSRRGAAEPRAGPRS